MTRCAPAAGAPLESRCMSAITPGSHVTLHYRMALLVDGQERELVDTFAAKPATLQLGVGQWAATLEERLLGLEEGAEAQFELPPEQAYGLRHDELVRRFGRDQLDGLAVPGWKAEAGEAVELRSAEGLSHRGLLLSCDAAQALVDFNHPLAGRALRLRVQVIGVL
jgi:FKBP-type peptidyl-prolyl cis-trans isomerase SlpA